MHFLWAGIIGLIGGTLGGLFGVGGGIVMVPAMTFFLGLPIHKAVGTSLLVIIPTAVTGAYKHYSLGNVDLKTAVSLVPLAMVGSYGGAWLTSHLEAATLKRAFGGFLIAVGCRLLLFK